MTDDDRPDEADREPALLMGRAPNVRNASNASIAKRPGLISAADIEPLPVYWLWYPYIPMGMVTLISGDPGLGKSWMTMALAADISAGRPLPNSRTTLPPRKVLVMNYEDPLAHTVVPRLIALDANLKNIVFPERYFPLDPEGIRLMESYLQETAAGLVFIDPIVAALGAGVDMHRANEVRAVMAALTEVASRSGAAIIAVRHLRKTGKEGRGKAIYAGLGSIDFTASVRSELMVEEAKTGERLVRHIKSNVGPKGSTLHYHYNEYETTDKRGEPVSTSRFEWLGLWDGPDESPMMDHLGLSKGHKAKEWLKTYLAGGPRPAQEAQKAALAAGFKLKTLRNAKKGLVRSIKTADEWLWELCATSNCDDGLTLAPQLVAEAQKRLAERPEAPGVDLDG